MSEALKPCPKCGAKSAYGDLHWVFKYADVRRHYFMCPECEVSTDSYSSEQAAFDAWNRGEVNE
ncbi:MAG: Lar family restriction alleviation protein [Pyramidobacter sp.]|nr:Lar family restriction alleviation protein [Pyramidobacter sp.]MBQ8129431.1 Lar family restriction alleviation protein [Clostridia bacterium]MBR1895989.1 Lar family restriction alleviation protein [Pyramidobacter sp.]